MAVRRGPSSLGADQPRTQPPPLTEVLSFFGMLFMFSLSLMVSASPFFVLKGDCFCDKSEGSGPERALEEESECTPPTADNLCPNAEGKSVTPLIAALLLGSLAAFCALVVRRRRQEDDLRRGRDLWRRSPRPLRGSEDVSERLLDS